MSLTFQSRAKLSLICASQISSLTSIKLETVITITKLTPIALNTETLKISHMAPLLQTIRR